MATDRTPDTGRTKARILIVDDDRLVLVGLTNALVARGYAVTAAATGEDSIARADAEPPDLILMDICLPGISGIEAARRIMEKHNVPTIFLSAFHSEEMVREAIAIGSISYLVKPVSTQQLLPAIENALARAGDIAKLLRSDKQLASALKQSREVSVAIGVLMERHDLGPEDAFAFLRAEARKRRRKVADLSKDILSGALRLEFAARGKGTTS